MRSTLRGTVTTIIMLIVARSSSSSVSRGLGSTFSRHSQLMKSMVLRTRGGSSVSNLSMTSTSTSSSSALASSADKLKALRKAMSYAEVDCFIVPTEDPHMSEYTAPYYYRREWISGFTGSAGTVVVTKTDALLFTDGRYHNQAEMELTAEWTLMRQGLKDVPSLVEWLAKELPVGSIIGVDPFLHAAATMKKIEETMAPQGITIKSIAENPIDKIWTEGRPACPDGVIRVHAMEYAGKSVADKLADLRTALAKAHTAALVSASLDEIAWMYNIRGSDVPCNPVTVAYAVVGTADAHLFIDAGKVPTEVLAHLAAAGVRVLPYEQALPYVKQLGEAGSKVWLDGKTVNYAVYSSVPEDLRVDKASPITLMKAVKNDAELRGMRACHYRDGAAESEFLAWLEEELAVRPADRPITEVELDERVTASRAALSPDGMFLEPSFPTIAGVNSNGAIVHYRAVPETAKTVGRNDMVLLDSGGQYRDGTTDVTRTFHTGEPTAVQREMFTRVLKGNIAIDSRVFIQGTVGCQLDSYAREHLWAIGKDYIHGTGHGVGAALNVHEGPHSISRVLNSSPLVPGMIVSNEPGYYEANNYGIRIENLLVVVERKELGEFGGRSFCGFERLTHIPIQKKLMDVSLLTDSEVAWIDSYHREVRERVGPLMQTDRGKRWLEASTAPLRSSSSSSGSSGNSGSSSSSSSAADSAPVAANSFTGFKSSNSNSQPAAATGVSDKSAANKDNKRFYF